jgi:hypothetical protein
MSYDVEAVRAHFPALAEGLAHFDGPGGTQVPQAVADAVAATMASAVSNRGGPVRQQPAGRRGRRRGARGGRRPGRAATRPAWCSGSR